MKQTHNAAKAISPDLIQPGCGMSRNWSNLGERGTFKLNSHLD